jgi:hypothetical protein
VFGVLIFLGEEVVKESMTRRGWKKNPLGNARDITVRGVILT